MPDKQIFFAPKSKWTLFQNGGAVLNWDSASEHRLFESVGHVGPIQKPLDPHNYNYYYDRISSARRNYSRRYLDGRSDYGTGDFLSTNPHSVVFDPPISFSNVNARALDKLNEAVRGNMDVSVDAFQGRQVLKTLRATERVADYTKTFFKKKFGVIKAIADMRLEYMYGVKPLMGTAFDAADELIRHQINKMQRFKVRANDLSYKPKTIALQTYYGTEIYTAHQVEIKLSAQYGVEMNVSNNKFDLRRWSSLNPVSIAWELMPWSFVADWVYDVGGYLRNLETVMAYGFDFRKGYLSNLAVFSGSISQTWEFTSNPFGSDSHTASFSGARFNRQTLAFYPSPQPPRLQVDLGSSRLLNGAALLAGFLGKADGGMKVPRGFEPNLYRDRVNESRNIKFRRKL